MRWWTFCESAWGCLFGLILEDVVSDKCLDDLLFPLRCLKIVLQKGLTVDFEKVSRSWLVCKSEQEKQQCFRSLVHLLAGGSQVYLVTARTSFVPFCPATALESLIILSMLGYVGAQMEHENILGKKYIVRDV